MTRTVTLADIASSRPGTIAAPTRSKSIDEPDVDPKSTTSFVDFLDRAEPDEQRGARRQGTHIETRDTAKEAEHLRVTTTQALVPPADPLAPTLRTETDQQSRSRTPDRARTIAVGTASGAKAGPIDQSRLTDAEARDGDNLTGDELPTTIPVAPLFADTSEADRQVSLSVELRAANPRSSSSAPSHTTGDFAADEQTGQESRLPGASDSSDGDQAPRSTRRTTDDSSVTSEHSTSTENTSPHGVVESLSTPLSGVGETSFDVHLTRLPVDSTLEAPRSNFIVANAPFTAAISRPREEGGGAYSVTAMLDPPSLGHVQAFVKVDGTSVSVSILAHSPDGHRALADHLDELHQELGAHGAKVELSLSDSGGQSRDRDEAKRPPAPIEAIDQPDTFVLTQLPAQAGSSLHVVL